MRDFYGHWLHWLVLGAFIVGVPWVHRRIGRRRMAAVAVLATIASLTWTHVRYGEPLVGWRSLALIGAVVVVYAFSAQDRDAAAGDGTIAPDRPGA